MSPGERGRASGMCAGKGGERGPKAPSPGNPSLWPWAPAFPEPGESEQGRGWGTAGLVNLGSAARGGHGGKCGRTRSQGTEADGGKPRRTRGRGEPSGEVRGPQAQGTGWTPGLWLPPIRPWAGAFLQEAVGTSREAELVFLPSSDCTSRPHPGRGLVFLGIEKLLCPQQVSQLPSLQPHLPNPTPGGGTRPWVEQHGKITLKSPWQSPLA